MAFLCKRRETLIKPLFKSFKSAVRICYVETCLNLAVKPLYLLGILNVQLLSCVLPAVAG